MIVDARLTRSQMLPSDLVFGMVWIVAYVLFEWCFFSATGVWHYPFMDYTKPLAPIAYAALAATFTWYWELGCKLTSRLSCG
jgi:tryptophan-rich sensory protein